MMAMKWDITAQDASQKSSLVSSRTIFVDRCGLSIIRQTSPSDAHKSAELNKVYHIMLIVLALSSFRTDTVSLTVYPRSYIARKYIKIYFAWAAPCTVTPSSWLMICLLAARSFIPNPAKGLSLFTWKRCGCSGWINACLPALSMEFALTFVNTQEILGFCKFCNLICGHKRINTMGKNAQLFVVADAGN